MNDASSAALKKEILALQSQLGTPYPAAVTPPIDTTIHNDLTNFLRSGPHRKVFALYIGGGDHVYDEGMSEDAEFAMEAECATAYKEALILAEGLFGRSQGDRPKKRNSFHEPDADDFTDKEAQEYDGIPWSLEYEGGAIYEESNAVRYWEIGGEYLFLQQGRWTGDGNFALFVLMTLTPRLEPSAATGDAEPGDTADTSGKPKDIVTLEKAIGDTLEEKNSDEVMDWFSRNSYSVDASNHVIGLNLRGNHLTDLEMLKAFHHLQMLNIADNAIADISAIAQFHNLRELSLGNNIIENLDGVESLTKLTALNVMGNKIRALDRIVTLTGLRALYADANAIADLQPLRNLTALVELGIADNEIADIDALKELPDLQTLKIAENKIAKLDVLARMKKLRHLEVDKNPAVTKMMLKLNKYENHLEAVRAALTQ